MARADMCMHVVAANYVARQTRLCVGYVGAESNASVAGEPTRPCISGIYYFGTEDGTFVESSTGEPSRPSCVPQE